MKLQTPPNRNASLEKATRILFAFDEGTPELGVMELSRRVGLNKSTVSRFVASLTGLGLLERAESGRKVRLSLRLYEIGMVALRHRPILGLVGATLTRTAARLGETTAVGVLIGGEIVFLERAGGGRESVRLELGRRFPASRSAAGRVLLAGGPQEPGAGAAQNLRPAGEPRRFADELSAVRELGYATELGEMIDGVNAVAAPIIDCSGKPIAAFSVLTNGARGGNALGSELIQAVTRAAAEVSRKLGYHRAAGKRRPCEPALQAEVG
ncbi:MAG: IclR family transcriptional regulator [Deltaproteobacteria bacterium]